MPDLLQQLRDARPSDADLDRMWPPEERAVALARILDTPSGTTRYPRRATWLAAAAAVAAIGVVPTVVDSGDAAAQADLEALAMAAVASDGPVIAEGTFLHVKTESLQQNSGLFGDGKSLDTNRESWVRWDGKKWIIESRPSEGWHEYHLFPSKTGDVSVNDPTPEFAASLPDDPEHLSAYLHEHVSGSNSHEEAIFVAVCDLARSHFLPPQTFAAALEVLADIDGVDTEDVTVEGRSAVQITYSSFWKDLIAEEWITIDRETARVLSEQESDPGGSYELTTTSVEVVHDLPEDIRADFQRLGSGTRVFE